MTIEQHAKNAKHILETAAITGGVKARLLVEIDAILAAFEWVDCADRLPQASRVVAGKMKDGTQAQMYYSDVTKNWASGFGINHRPTHWRELL